MATLMRVRTVLTGWTGSPGLNTWYFGTPDGSQDSTNAADAVARVRAFWFAIKAGFPAAFTAQVNPIVDTLDIASGELTGSLAGGSPAVVNGTSAQSYNSIPSMILLRGATGTVVNGRRLVGRMNIGPVDSNQDVAGAPDATFRNTISAAAVVALSGSTDAFPGVWHRPKNGSGGVLNGITAWSTWGSWAVLRSRRD